MWTVSQRALAAIAVTALACVPACKKDDSKSDKSAKATPVNPDKGDSAAKPGASRPTPDKPAKPASPKLDNPDSLTAKAPDKFRARFETTKGTFVIEVVREWSPNGADRFYNLVVNDYFTGVRFFRVVKGFMAQFGIHGDPSISQQWAGARIQDDPVVQSNTRSYVTFAKSSAPNSRSTQIFINYGNNKNLDRMGFSPFGKVVEGMDVVDKFENKYGEATTKRQGDIYANGNGWLDQNFPGLDHIVKATVVQDAAKDDGQGEKKDANKAAKQAGAKDAKKDTKQDTKKDDGGW